MPSYAGPPVTARPGEVASTLWLLGYLALAIALIILDHRGGWLSQVRAHANVATQPVWWLAASPGRLAEGAGRLASTHTDLHNENLRLTRELQVSASRLHRLVAVADENQRLRELLGGTRGYRLSAQLVGIIDIDLDPSRREEMMKLSGRRTVPQIFIGDYHVGGCDELFALDRAGKLEPLLCGTPS